MIEEEFYKGSSVSNYKYAHFIEFLEGLTHFKDLGNILH